MNENKPEKAVWLKPLVDDHSFHVQFCSDYVHVELGRDSW